MTAVGLRTFVGTNFCVNMEIGQMRWGLPKPGLTKSLQIHKWRSIHRYVLGYPMTVKAFLLTIEFGGTSGLGIMFGIL